MGGFRWVAGDDDAILPRTLEEEGYLLWGG